MEMQGLDSSLISEITNWIAEDPDPKTRTQLQQWLDQGNESELRSCFAGFLEFGTAGLRGALGPGPSRMNRADRKSTRLNSSHVSESRMPSSA